MSYRDWGRGEDGPRPRRSTAPWEDPDPSPVDDEPAERFRTPSRRRAIERGQDEPVDEYLPRWALESGVRSADGGGRHAAPDDDDDDLRGRPRYGGRGAVEAANGLRRVGETRWRELPAIGAAPESDHTREWTLDRPQEQGYVGSRRADDDDPVSGVAPRSRPRRQASRRPQVTWSGLDDGAAAADRRTPEVERPTRRSRRAGAEEESQAAPADSWARALPAESEADLWRRTGEPRPVSPEPEADPWAAGGARALSSRPEAEPWRPARKPWAVAPETAFGEDRAAEPEPRYRPAVDPWERSAEPRAISSRPEVDPWDASGVHTWQSADGADRWDRSTAADRWDQPDSTGQWDRPDSTDRWDRPDSTGQWDQPGSTGRWDQPDSAGRWHRYSDGGVGGGRWEGSEPPRSGGGSGTGDWSWSGRDESDGEFWSGTRLAGDDPRWVDAPSSAPRSPAVSYSAPRPHPAPRRSAAPVPAARDASMAAVRRRLDAAGAGGWNRRLEDDLLDPDEGGPWRPLLYTAACYVLPAMVVFVWLLTLDGQAPAGCVTDISGGGCESPRTRAFGSMLAGLPRFGLAMASSLVVAVLLRRVGTAWRSTTVALAAAVVGGGMSTVMISAVTGQPIG
ncbi:hypothetical protein GA0070616_2566 [Micromonospora nigra]|uniref:Uncharacterized protein n=1 Tax=Micromonospora nigra TaxID=145857 RepID=A0A1C6RZF2_9ACTN|nr:hypothetical protein [Micromonospora nigra]SCL22590.1 hypothetical protein GA0070616_2566 [Micromonospora nigra]